MKHPINLSKSLALGMARAMVLSAATAQAISPIQPFTASKTIDLTQPMHDDMVFWPGGVPFKKERLVDYDPGGYQLHKFIMGKNTGTHVDAPSHFIKGNKPIDQLALEHLIPPIVVLDAQHAVAKNNDYELTPADIKNWEAEHGKVPANSLFVMNTAGTSASTVRKIYQYGRR